MSFILLSINRFSNLYVWHKREIRRKFFGSVGCLPSFISAIIWLFLHIIGIILTHFMQFFNISNSYLLVCCPKFFICSVLISSRPGAFFSFIRAIATLSSSKVNGVCNILASFVGSLTIFGFTFLISGHFPFIKSWWAISYGMTFICGSALFGSLSYTQKELNNNLLTLFTGNKVCGISYIIIK